jgi:hypothetical protein
VSDDQDEEKRRPGVPKYYYWGKKPPKAKKVQTGFVNGQQKRFYAVQLLFRTAKVTAVLVVLLLIFSRI